MEQHEQTLHTIDHVEDLALTNDKSDMGDDNHHVWQWIDDMEFNKDVEI